MPLLPICAGTIPKAFAPLKGVLRSGKEKAFWAFSKPKRLKRYGYDLES